jgi:hypothetical protein
MGAAEHIKSSKQTKARGAELKTSTAADLSRSIAHIMSGRVPEIG